MNGFGKVRGLIKVRTFRVELSAKIYQIIEIFFMGNSTMWLYHFVEKSNRGLAKIDHIVS